MSCSETATLNIKGLDIPALRQHVLKPGALLAEFTGGEGESRLQRALPCALSPHLLTLLASDSTLNDDVPRQT